MAAIPSRLAQIARSSKDHADARTRVVDLYRAWIRGAPEVVEMYALPVTPAYVRHCIRQKFEANRHVTDLRAIDVLILKGQQELQETLNCWKQPDHVMGILLTPTARPQRSFMQKFLEGRDEDAVRPAASGVA